MIYSHTPDHICQYRIMLMPLGVTIWKPTKYAVASIFKYGLRLTSSQTCHT